MIPTQARLRSTEIAFLCSFVVSASIKAAAAEPLATDHSIEISYGLTLVPADHGAKVTIQLRGAVKRIRSLRFRIDGHRYSHFQAPADVQRTNTHLVWSPSTNGTKLSYKIGLDHPRARAVNAGPVSYDEKMTSNWALFRGDNLVPPATIRIQKNTPIAAHLQVTLPPGWKFVAPYPKNPDGSYRIENPARHFDRPTGWMAAGHLGIVRETIDRTKVTIASPPDSHFRRLDVLALLRWTLPVLNRVADHAPERLVFVGGGDPLWPGGLSGPRSAYLHAKLPLISHDGTSPPLHELVHALMSARAGPGGDWIVEGMAELYSLELLYRSGTISEHRYKRTLARLKKRGSSIKTVDVDTAHGALTAQAVTVLHKLDLRIRRQTENKASLDDVIKRMVATPTAWTTQKFRLLCEQVLGKPLVKFFTKYAAPSGSLTTP